MRRVLWAFALSACVVPARAQQPPSANKVEYKAFISQDGRFSALLPARPTVTTNKADNDAAGPSHVFLLERGDTAYYISYTDFKAEVIKNTPVNKLLDGARDGGVANSKGKLLSEKKMLLDGSPGREISIELPGDPKTNARARFYLVDNRLYSIIFAGPVPVANGSGTDSFLASLKLYKPKALPETWMPLVATEGHFSIKMPGKPSPSVDGSDPKDAVHLWQLILDGSNITYIAAYNDLPASPENGDDIEKALDAGIAAVAKSLSATVEEQRDLSVDGNPGREVHMRSGAKDAADGTVVVLRCLLVKDRYYQLMALGSKAAMAAGRIDDFMNSFQLTAPTTGTH